MLNESILSRGHVLQRNIEREIEFMSLVEIFGSRENVCDNEDGLTGKNEAKMRESLRTIDQAKSICDQISFGWREWSETWLGQKVCIIRSTAKVANGGSVVSLQEQHLYEASLCLCILHKRFENFGSLWMKNIPLSHMMNRPGDK